MTQNSHYSSARKANYHHIIVYISDIYTFILKSIINLTAGNSKNMSENKVPFHFKFPIIGFQSVIGRLMILNW